MVQRYQQPQSGPFRVNTGNPLTANLRSLIIGGAGRSIIVGNQSLPFVGVVNSTTAGSPKGPGLHFNGSSQWEQLPPGSLSEGIHTRVAMVRWDGVSRSTISSGITINGALLWEIQQDGALVQVKTNAVETVHSAGGVVVAGEICVLAMSWDGTTSRLYKNGMQVTASGYTGGFNAGATPVLGKHYDNVFYFGGDLFQHADFGVALPQSQIKAISDNMAQLIAPTQRFSFAPAAAGGTAASVTATDGADVIAANASVSVAISSATTDGADLLTGNASVIVSASSATTDAADAFAATVSTSGTTASSATTDGADVLAAAVGPQVAAASATTDGMDGLAANTGPIVGITSATVDGSDTLSSNVAPVQSVAISAAIADGADGLVANVFTSAPGGGGGPSSEPRKTKRFLVNHDGQTLAFDTRRAAERAVYQLGVKAVLVAQPVATSATRLAAQRTIDDAQEEEDELEMLLLAL